ncbi:MAG TPA: hypothetical protein VGE66_07460 [Chitinophagaceae bacterium]
MAQDNNRNTGKNRKSETRERFEQADNAGRFAGNDADALAARRNMEENIRQDTSSHSEERNKGSDQRDTPARRGTGQAQDTAGDAQNEEVDGTGRLEGKEAENARQKADEGIRQGRDD